MNLRLRYNLYKTERSEKPCSAGFFNEDRLPETGLEPVQTLRSGGF